MSSNGGEMLALLKGYQALWWSDTGPISSVRTTLETMPQEESELDWRVYSRILQYKSRPPQPSFRDESQIIVQSNQELQLATEEGSAYDTFSVWYARKIDRKEACFDPWKSITETVSVFIKPKKRSSNAFHITLLAKNSAGYANLVKLSSIGFIEGFYYIPRIDIELLKIHSEGLLCLSGCIKSPFTHAITTKNPDLLRFLTEEFKTLFKEDFFFVLQRHSSTREALELDGTLDESWLFQQYQEAKTPKNSGDLPDKNPLTVVQDRLDYELNIITTKGMTDYLLFESPILNRSDQTSFSSDLSIQNGFEVDICMDRRPEVIRYTINTYRKENVAQIITFGTMKEKMSIKDVGRVLNIPLSKFNYIAKLILDDLNITIEKALEKDLLNLYETDDDAKSIIILDKALEGSIRNTGIHAAGLIFSGKPLMENVPVTTAKDSDMFVTHYSMKPVEMVGMLKIDFLGLKTLTSIQIAIDAIYERLKIKIDWINLDLDDLKTFEILNQGKTLGIFQIESGGMQNNFISTLLKKKSWNYFDSREEYDSEISDASSEVIKIPIWPEMFEKYHFVEMPFFDIFSKERLMGSETEIHIACRWVRSQINRPRSPSNSQKRVEKKK
ncbi:hypothetical protein ACTFIW_000968 [Dictyostelium discoideum]